MTDIEIICLITGFAIGFICGINFYHMWAVRMILKKNKKIIDK